MIRFNRKLGFSFDSEISKAQGPYPRRCVAGTDERLESGGAMTIRNVALFGIGAVLSGCAAMGSSPGQPASAQMAVYTTTKDAGGTMTASATASDAAPTTTAVAVKVEKAQGETKPLRIFWFFGDR